MTLCTNVLLFLYVLCRIWWYWRDVLVLRRNSREWQLGDVISWCKKQWTVQFWSYDLISEVSTNGVFILTSRRLRFSFFSDVVRLINCYIIIIICHVWLCDVASPIPSWHRLRRGGVTFGRLAVIDFDECYCLLIYCVVRFRTLVHFVRQCSSVRPSVSPSVRPCDANVRLSVR